MIKEGIVLCFENKLTKSSIYFFLFFINRLQHLAWRMMRTVPDERKTTRGILTLRTRSRVSPVMSRYVTARLELDLL